MSATLSENLPATSQLRKNASLCSQECDDDLISAAQFGDDQAFLELCKRHMPLVRKKIFGIVRNPDDTEDLLQDTLLRAYMHLSSFRRSCKFSTWMTSIGVNSALMLLRKRKTRKEMQTGLWDDAATEVWEPVDMTLGPDSLYQRQQTVLLIRGEMERLRPSLRSIVDLYYRTEQSVEELAEQLEISTGAAKSRLMRGRAALRLRLERHGISNACI